MGSVVATADPSQPRTSLSPWMARVEEHLKSITEANFSLQLCDHLEEVGSRFIKLGQTMRMLMTDVEVAFNPPPPSRKGRKKHRGRNGFKVNSFFCRMGFLIATVCSDPLLNWSFLLSHKQHVARGPPNCNFQP